MKARDTHALAWLQAASAIGIAPLVHCALVALLGAPQ
jgi:hypothetical protein